MKNVEQIIPTSINNDAQLSEDTITVTKSELLQLFRQFIQTELTIDLDVVDYFEKSVKVTASLKLEDKEITSSSDIIWLSGV